MTEIAPRPDAAKAMAASVDSAQVLGGSRGYWATVGSRLLRDRVTMICASVLVLIFLSAIFADLLATHDPYRTSIARRLRPIGFDGHPLGTDELGRDMLTRLL